MGSAGIKVGIAVFFVWLSAQLGTVAQEILGRVRESVQASELLTVDKYLAVWVIEQKRSAAPGSQEAFERALREELSAGANRDVTLDRWEQKYLYEKLGDSPPAWRITSKGPDKTLGTDDDLIVERRGDSSHINQDPAALAESAIERKLELDREALRRLQRLADQAEGFEGQAGQGEATPDELREAFAQHAETLDALLAE
jgi:hypothetical protein